MNTFFKGFLLFLLCASNTYAREIILLTYQDKNGQHLANYAKSFLTNELNIPRSFISLKKQSNACLKSGAPLIHFCINDQGELWPIVFEGPRIAQSFKVFIDGGKK